jgi:hypothetical protein
VGASLFRQDSNLTGTDLLWAEQRPLYAIKKGVKRMEQGYAAIQAKLVDWPVRKSVRGPPSGFGDGLHDAARWTGKKVGLHDGAVAGATAKPAGAAKRR